MEILSPVDSAFCLLPSRHISLIFFLARGREAGSAIGKTLNNLNFKLFPGSSTEGYLD
jgi:hypothetical protein